ncbi:hypothetical protein J4526_05000 [Desulfurococcaceae archaeon MEX13E-LK6-19]|nr:hypothetical protein J4526_05000 [Desulfurococcaceae archaeon MEX13E-LK6-19]
MLMLDDLNNILENVLKEARRKWIEAWVERIKVSKRKFIVFMVVSNNKVKVIIYRDNIKVRVYSQLKGLSISLKKIIQREYEKHVRLKERESKEESI